ncbi:hypothetical protein GCM10023078_08700 [Gibbsiella greigii]
MHLHFNYNLAHKLAAPAAKKSRVPQPNAAFVDNASRYLPNPLHCGRKIDNATGLKEGSSYVPRFDS